MALKRSLGIHSKTLCVLLCSAKLQAFLNGIWERGKFTKNGALPAPGACLLKKWPFLRHDAAGRFDGYAIFFLASINIQFSTSNNVFRFSTAEYEITSIVSSFLNN